ncbi:Crp/Fnr family transcriptional regulator [Novosphingobium sp.]|uniref:Crp/Fnr family transcriptional regulator n=1 Tax=Novosphingobium sp. TaxID=1874826 RepID=UPI00286B5A26|nr:Crp/Fnr family transcriptional regulator [Novosphingobium sp.]
MEAVNNNLLRALQPQDRESLSRSLTFVELASGDMLYDPGDLIEQCFFPCDAAIASFHVVTAEGEAIETALIGREGALGGIVSHGSLPAFARAVVVQGGTFAKVPLATLEALKRERLAVDRLFTRYADCFIAQTFQSVACNAIHSAEQRAARWLCGSLDRTAGNTIRITQEQLAALLGVGRAYISRVLQSFRQRGLIALHRGGLTITDEAGLRRLSCDCDALVRDHFDRVLRGVYPD